MTIYHAMAIQNPAGFCNFVFFFFVSTCFLFHCFLTCVLNSHLCKLREIFVHVIIFSSLQSTCTWFRIYFIGTKPFCNASHNDSKTLNLHPPHPSTPPLFEYFPRKLHFHSKKIDIDWVPEKDKMCKTRYISKAVCFIIPIIDK